MSKFVSYLRLIEFDENIALLYSIKGDWGQRRRRNPNDSDDDVSSYFNGDEVPAISKANERKVWLRIKDMAEEALARYPHTLEEDREMLAADTPEYTNLTFNTRNIVLFRSGEKEILTFLIDMADFVLNLLEMSFKDGKRHT